MLCLSPPLFLYLPLKGGGRPPKLALKAKVGGWGSIAMHLKKVTPTPTLALLGGGSSLHAAREKLTLATIPAEDPAVYRMLQRADSLGVFQIESRAQMTMLPRLKPENFYDLVVEVAIVRPGPIQGDMVHPYLRRRQGLEPVSYPSEELKAVLGKTLGVPLFQEQAMKIAIVAGGFTPAEADKLRRAMATFRRVGTIGTFQHKMIEGMVANGYDRDFAERCFHQIEGFGEYGFPESHAASFALLVYASAWLKCHYPDVFAAALLNAQPMGFYAPAQIVRDLREHGVKCARPNVNFSDYDATLGPGPPAAKRLHELHRGMADDIPHALRHPPRPARDQGTERGRGEADCGEADFSSSPFPPRSYFLYLPPERGRVAPAEACFAAKAGETGGGQSQCARRSGPPPLTLPPSPPTLQIRGREQSVREERGKPYNSLRDLWLRTGLTPRVIERLADADAFGSLGLTRRDALWAVKALRRSGDHEDLPLFRAGAAAAREPDVALTPMPPGEEVVNDYRFLKLSLRAHPASFLRADLARRHIAPNETLRSARNGARVRSSGLITVRQRPGTAKGVIFMTIEDESGDRQCHRLAEAVRTLPPGGAGRALRRRIGPHAGGKRRHPCGRQPARGFNAAASAASRRRRRDRRARPLRRGAPPGAGRPARHRRARRPQAAARRTDRRNAGARRRSRRAGARQPARAGEAAAGGIR